MELCRISHTIDKLRAKHTALQALNRDFLDMAHEYQLYCFREMLEPKVVDELSSRLSMLYVDVLRVRFGVCCDTKLSVPGTPSRFRSLEAGTNETTYPK